MRFNVRDGGDQARVYMGIREECKIFLIMTSAKSATKSLFFVPNMQISSDISLRINTKLYDGFAHLFARRIFLQANYHN